MNKVLLIPILITFGTMLLLFLVGYFFKIESLGFRLTIESQEVALLPIFIGIVVGYISKRIMKLKL